MAHVSAGAVVMVTCVVDDQVAGVGDLNITGYCSLLEGKVF